MYYLRTRPAVFPIQFGLTDTHGSGTEADDEDDNVSCNDSSDTSTVSDVPPAHPLPPGPPSTPNLVEDDPALAYPDPIAGLTIEMPVCADRTECMGCSA